MQIWIYIGKYGFAEFLMDGNFSLADQWDAKSDSIALSLKRNQPKVHDSCFSVSLDFLRCKSIFELRIYYVMFKFQNFQLS